MGGATAGQVVLGGIRKQTEQAMESEPANRVPSWPPLRFLSRVPALPSLPDGL